MRFRFLLAFAWLLALSCPTLSGCGSDGNGDSDVTDVVDAQETDPGDPCVEVETCAHEGTRCVGQVLTTCAADPQTGCIVKTEEQNCAATEFGLCDELAGPDCVVRHPCDGVSNCSAVGRACDQDVLVNCQLDAAGCRVETREDCAANGLRCDDRGEFAYCGYNPCDDVEAPCFAAGRSCDGDVLEVCEPDVYGCLSLHTYDCATAETTCTTAGAAGARCDKPSACSTPAACSAEGSSCDASRLTICHRNEFGCFEQLSAACSQTQVGAGFCNTAAEPRPACAITFNEACGDADTCATAGRRCDGNVLVDCSPNAQACLIETRTDCAADADVCIEDDGNVSCVDPCTLVNSCPQELYCDGNNLVTCTRNENNCLVPDTQSNCAQNGQVCDGTLSPPACAAPPIVNVSTSPNQSIYDNDSVVSSINVTSPCASIRSVKVQIDISHTYIGDLTLELRGPTGVSATLHNGTGGSTDNIVGTYPDTLTPSDSLDVYIGTNGTGSWSLTVTDDASGDNGRLNSWGLTILCG